MNVASLLIPIISAFTGWFTTWIAIKMLFHPKEPKRFLGITFQGVFPKRQMQFAQKLGSLVSTELISFDDIKAKFNNPALMQSAMPMINERLDIFLKEKLNEHLPLVSMFISADTINKIKGSITTELENSIPAIMNQMAANMKNEINIEQMVTDKVAAFSTEKLEDIMNVIMTKEFRFVEVVGGVFGFIIGLIQLAISFI